VLCIDEKSQIQALDRTQPLLPMRPGQVEYPRLQTTWDNLAVRRVGREAGTIIGKCMSRHRAPEFRRFLDTVEQNVPADLDIHIIMDNASSHKTKLTRNWFAKRPRWQSPFHAYVCILDQSGRALLRTPHRTADQAWSPSLNQGSASCNRCLHRRQEC